MTTSAQIPVCVYCRTARPADRTACPTCGRSWIDIRIGTREPVAVAAAVAATAPLTAAASNTAAPAVADPPAEPADARHQEQPAADTNGAASPQETPATETTTETAVAVAAGAAVVAGAPGPPATPTPADTNGSAPPWDSDTAEDVEEEPEVAETDAVVAATATAAAPEAKAAATIDEPTGASTNGAGSGAEHAIPEAESAVPPPPPPPPPIEEGTRSGNRWVLPAILGGAALFVLLAVVAFVTIDRGGASEAAPAEAPNTTTSQAPSTEAPATTPAPATTAETPATTTQPPPTTTEPPTTTTLVPPPGAFRAIGAAIPIEELTLRATGLGPIVFGTDSEEAIGRLVASLGRADDTGLAGTELGMCAEDEGIWVRWGDLTAIIEGDGDSGTLAGFRHVEIDPSGASLPLATPSGIRIGDSLSDLERAYRSYKLAYESVDGAMQFRLMDSDGVLLWGPITSTDAAGTVVGIYSPPSCPAS